MKFKATFKGGSVAGPLPRGAAGRVVNSRSAFKVEGCKEMILANNVQDIHKTFGKVKVKRLQNFKGKVIDITEYMI